MRNLLKIPVVFYLKNVHFACFDQFSLFIYLFVFFFNVYSACFEHIFSTLKAASQNVALYCFCNLFSIPEIIRYVRSRFEIKTVTNVDRYPLWSPLFWLVLVEVRKFIRQSIQIIQPSLCKTYNNGRKLCGNFSKYSKLFSIVRIFR